ncbi:MAG: DUF2190 family protein [Puniceicoccales bacterium]|jgi:hypothetical protein|nr:DUF2190 family protein [Puniceicoccales bacterium]
MTQSTQSKIGTHDCNITKQAEEGISQKYLLGKLGSSETGVAVCGISDFPIGIITDEAAAPDVSGESAIVNVALLGGATTLQAVASGSVAAGALLVPAAGGKVQSLPEDSGTYNVIGLALTSATADGSRLEFMSCVPQLRVVS